MLRPPASSVPSGRRALVFNSGWLLAEKGIRLVVGQALVTMLLARYLGPADFGVFNFAIALVALFGSLAGLGLEEILVRELVRRPAAEHPLYLATVWRLKMIGAVVAALLALGVAAILRADEPRVWGVVALLAGGLLFTPWDVFDTWFQSQSRFGPAVAARLVAFLLSAAARVGIVLAGEPLWMLAAAVALEPLGAAIGLAVAGRRAGARRVALPVDKQLTGTLLAEGWPLLLSGLFVLATMQFDKVLVGLIAGYETAGYYAAATRLTELFYAVPVALGAAAIPALARRRQTDRAGYWQAARWLLIALAGIGTAVAALIAWRADDLIHTAYGDRYQMAVAPLAAHVWSLGFVFIVSLRGRLLVLEGKGSWLPALTGTAALANIALNLWWVPRYGATGAGWAATTAWGFSALLVPLLFPPIRPLVREFFGAPAKS